MASTEVSYNSYFHILQETYRTKFEEAKNNCWLICVPSTEALRGIEIDERFVELHILHPILDCGKPSCYTSTDNEQSLILELEGDTLTLLSIESKNADSYCAKIINEEIGYNNKFHPYKILILDKVLSPEIKATVNNEEDWIKLNECISSLLQAHQFLFSCPNHAAALPQLKQSISMLRKEMCETTNLEDGCDILRQSVTTQWSNFLITHPQHRQRDSKFQFLLSVALENYIVSCVHEPLFYLISATLSREDSEIHARTFHLAKLGVSPDQLGAPEDFAVPLPAAVVELAALDSLQSPIEKLACIRACLDLILAEVKGALVDVQSIAADDEVSTLPSVASEDLIPLLVAVLIHAKPLHLVSNLFYMEHCQWTLAPNDPLSDSLVTFRSALQILLDIKVEELRPRNSKVHRELALQDLILVTDEIEQPDRKVLSPLDRQLDSIAAMIEASTRESRHQDTN